MLRTDAVLAALLSTALLTACDPGEAGEPDLLLTQDDDASPVEPAASDAIAAEADWTSDQACESYYFATRQNDSDERQCAPNTPAPNLTILLPDWDDILDQRLMDSATAACTVSGAQNGDGILPFNQGGGPGGPGGGVPAEMGIDQLAVAGQAAPQGNVPLPGFNPLPPPAPPVCEGVCQSHGKVWDVNGANFGTCAFNVVTSLNPPQHIDDGQQCLSPDTRRWQTTGGVLFDCGCRCI